MKRRASDWKKQEVLVVSALELIATLVTDSVPYEFGIRGLRDKYSYRLNGDLHIPENIFFSKNIDLRNINFTGIIYSDNISFVNKVKLPKEAVVASHASHKEVANA
jgi:hypothetical protein